MSDIKTPYLNGHMYEFDLCWLVEKILSFESQLNQAIDLKTIHYADPIQWDITTQYAPNTVVVDPKTGTAYMSKVPVPAGILLTNVDYWTVIFNYQNIYTKIMEGVAFYNGQTDFASKALLVNDLVWYGLDLYRVTRAIEEGGKLIPGTNLVKTSIESLLSNYYGRDRVATLLNDTLNVSGDYTVNAGDITKTADNETIALNSDLTLDVKGHVNLSPLQNPLIVAPPSKNDDYNTIKIVDSNNDEYNILLGDKDFVYNRSIVANGTGKDKQFAINQKYDDDALIGSGIGEDYFKSLKTTDNTITVATYNILSSDYWRWPPTPPTDTDTGLAAAVATMVKSGAIIIGLNEVSDNKKYTPLDKIKMVRFKNQYYKGGYDPGLQGTSLGNAIVSSINYPLYDTNVTVLPDGSINRFLLNAKIHVNDKIVSFYSTHLSLDDSRRSTQIDTIINMINNDQTEYKILTGDLNLLPSDSDFTKIINSGLKSVNTDLPTYPSNAPTSIIDYIFVTNNLQVINYNTIANIEGSDHCLLYSTLYFK